MSSRVSNLGIKFRMLQMARLDRRQFLNKGDLIVSSTNYR
jgi:hypothetical protein